MYSFCISLTRRSFSTLVTTVYEYDLILKLLNNKLIHLNHFGNRVVVIYRPPTYDELEITFDTFIVDFSTFLEDLIVFQGELLIDCERF